MASEDPVWDDYLMAGLGTGAQGAMAGFAVGSVPGAIGGGLAGLATGLYSAHQQQELMEAAEARQKEIEEEISGIDVLGQFMSAAGAASSLQRTEAKAAAPGMAQKAGLVGGEAADLERTMLRDVNIASQQGMASAIGPAAQATTMAKREALSRHMAQQDLANQAMSAPTAADSFGQLAGLAMQYGMLQDSIKAKGGTTGAATPAPGATPKGTPGAQPGAAGAQPGAPISRKDTDPGALADSPMGQAMEVGVGEGYGRLAEPTLLSGTPDETFGLHRPAGPLGEFDAAGYAGLTGKTVAEAQADFSPFTDSRAFQIGKRGANVNHDPSGIQRIFPHPSMVTQTLPELDGIGVNNIANPGIPGIPEGMNLLDLYGQYVAPQKYRNP